MKLRTQITLFGLVGVVPACLISAIALVNVNALWHEVADATVAGKAMQASQQADMMHDAIRGDTQLAVLGALQSNQTLRHEAASGLRAHAQEFKAQIQQLESLPLEQNSRQALADVKPVLEQYIADAEKIVQAADKDAEAAQAHTQAFQASFLALEQQMGALSDSIGDELDKLNAQASQDVMQTRSAVSLSLLLAVVGLMGGAWWLAQRMSEPIVEVANLADRMAKGDLSCEIHVSGNEETARLLDAMQRMQKSLLDIIAGVRASAESVATASTQIAQGNEDLSQRTVAQASALGQTTTAMVQLSAAVKLNTDSATQANQLAKGASDVATRGGHVVSRVVETMKGINDASTRIADIISVIDGIAFQTNILALNAAVEAARAGEQGRGFAVVAGEVRSLAQRSANAAKEISALINTSVSRVEEGSELVDQAGSTMQEIVSSIQRVTDIMGEIASANAEQVQGIDQVGLAVSDMDRTTQHNAALVEESAAAAASLRDQAQRLVQSVGVFKLA